MRTALVTSSNNSKMENVYRAHSEFKKLFDTIITADMFAHSKPDPECFLKGMKLLQTDAAHSVVFEDSFHGLEAGKRAGAFVIGLATTNSRQAIEGKADYIIDDFSDKNIAWLENTILNK
jgi:haloacid dehalogenase superfamily, subfamily IA, variant 3 with third motif having DD or ED